MQAEVVRIAYAPGSYAVAWRDSYAALPSLQRQWVNTLILRTHRLVAPDSLEIPEGRLARRLVQAWGSLERVAMLMGAARLRRHVLAQRASVLLPASVHAFMRQGHAEAELAGAAVELAASPAFLMAWGAGELQLAAPLLPRWLADRLPLMFACVPGVQLAPTHAHYTQGHFQPAHSQLPHLPPHPSWPGGQWDASLFWSALRHAEALS